LIKLILADDHPVFISGLRAVFDAEHDITVMSVATTGREAVQAASDHQPDVAVLDLNMPDGDGLWVCGQLRAAGLATRALILTMYDDDENVLAALRAGAYGYTLKGSAPEEIVAAVRGSLAARRFSARGSRLKCSATSAARLHRRRSRSSPSASTRCWVCWPPAATMLRSPAASE
jgi:DNA-binding NarL/FixJ family response regulator